MTPDAGKKAFPPLFPYLGSMPEIEPFGRGDPDLGGEMARQGSRLRLEFSQNERVEARSACIHTHTHF